MIESPLAHHAVEWPAPGARVRGPVIWLRGWIVPKPGVTFVDVRARSPHGLARGVLGLPRVDLARHFGSSRAWLPAGFSIGVTVPDGTATLHLEAQDEHGRWITLGTWEGVVAPEGAAPDRSEGELSDCDTRRVPHLPFHGHLDEPSSHAETGVVTLFGWLLHETARITRVTATVDGRVFWPLHHGLTDESLAQLVPLPAARHARLRGAVPMPPTLSTPASLRVYAELEDGSAHLCFASRIAALEPVAEVAPSAPEPLGDDLLPLLPSGRPRRLLMVLRTLRPDDATRRALDVATYLRASGRWAVRAVATEDGACREAFEAVECPCQLLDVSGYVGASGPEAGNELEKLRRQVWWRHLDAVALFDPISEWAGKLAQREGLPVFRDPVASLAWFSPDAERWRFDPAAPFLAPLRGLAAHGATTLLAALSTDDAPPGPAVVLSDLRDHAEEALLRLALAQAPRLREGAAPATLGALVNPAFRDPPHHSVLTAAAAGIPILTTPSPLLRAAFPAGEVVFVPPGNPLAWAHALADLTANPAAATRRAAAAQRAVFARHHPADHLARWLRALEATARCR